MKLKQYFFHPQENNLIASLESLRESAIEYFNNVKSKEKEQVLRAKIRQVYLEYAVYDRAMWEAITAQTTESDYSFYTFDVFYEELSKEMEIPLLKEKTKSFTRESQMKSVKSGEIQKLRKNKRKSKEKKSGFQIIKCYLFNC